MAAPIRAPLLSRAKPKVPDATSAALGALRPRGGAASGGAAVLRDRRRPGAEGG